MSKPITCCHNCGSTWSPGSTEWEWQKCSSCGWVPGQPIVDEDDEDFDEYEDDYDSADNPEL